MTNDEIRDLIQVLEARIHYLEAELAQRESDSQPSPACMACIDGKCQCE